MNDVGTHRVTPEPPAIGAASEVVAGVWWLRLPMPFALDHVNVWALADGEGWTIVDTGLGIASSFERWREWLAGPLQGRPVTRVLVTHMHPDHIGAAGWLTQRFNCRLWMTCLEYLNCRVLMMDTGRAAPVDAIEFYRRAGWNDDQLDAYRQRFGRFGRNIHALPDSYRRLRDGELLTIGERSWRVVVGAGHSPEHACFYCEELGLLISGDQVLPRISSNVSVFPTEPDADPLSEWLASLDKLKRTVPDDVLVMPAHHDCFIGLHARLGALQADTEQKLARLRTALHEPKRVVDLYASLYKRPIKDGDMIQLATGESVAYLNYLLRRGEITRHDDGAAAFYRLI